MTSSESNLSEPQATPPGVPLKARLIKWLVYTIMGGLLLLLVLGVVGTITQLGELPECDSKRSRDTMSDVFQAQNLSLTKYNEIKTVASSKDEVTCLASLAIKGGGTLIADYTFYWEESKVKVRYKLTRQ